MVADPLGAMGWWSDPVEIERLKGSSGYEDEFEPTKVRYGFYDGGIRNVRNATGDQMVSTATVFFPPDEPFIPAGSLVKGPGGKGVTRPARVIECKVHTHTLPVPAHLEVILE